MSGTDENWTTLASELILDRSPYVKVYQERVRTTRGAIIDDYFRVAMPAFVICVPVTADGRIVTLWQYKHGPRTVSLTFPAGFLDEAEAPETASRRELLEETGYAAGRTEAMGHYVDAGNQGGATGHYFLATGCEECTAPDSRDLEEMQIRLMTRDEVDTALARGDMAISHHALGWLLARQRLAE